MMILVLTDSFVVLLVEEFFDGLGPPKTWWSSINESGI